MSKTILIASAVLLALATTACQESIEERAQREAREYTEKYCPTPPQNDVITDSIVFNPQTRTQTSYLRFTGMIDNAETIRSHGDDIKKTLLENIRQNTDLRQYKEAGFKFEYVCRSEKDPKQILLNMKYSPKDYN